MTTSEMIHNSTPGEEEEEALDPRIQHELEVMNKSSLYINKFEAELDNERRKFRLIYLDSLDNLNKLQTKLGDCIHKAMPYYDCRLKAKEAQNMVTDATIKYEKALSMRSAAQEMVDLTEQGYERKTHRCDMAWKEMLHHSTIKLLDAETEKISCQVEVRNANQFLSEAQSDVKRQYKLHKRSITKSKPYYELKAKYHESLEKQRGVSAKLEKDTAAVKLLYSKAMTNLEHISEEIHTRRSQVQQQHSEESATDQTSPGSAVDQTKSAATDQPDSPTDLTSHPDQQYSSLGHNDYLEMSDNHFSENRRSQMGSLTEEVCSKLNIEENHFEKKSTASQKNDNDAKISTKNRHSSLGTEPTLSADSGYADTSPVGSSSNSLDKRHSTADRDEGIVMIEVPTTDENEDSDDMAFSESSSDSSPVMLKKRSSSFIQTTAVSNGERSLLKTRSMSFPYSHSESAPELKRLGSNGVLNRSDSSVLDDTCIEGALSYKYFDPSANNNQTSTETVIMVEDEHGNQQDVDYETLPSKLSVYQKQYTLSRRNTIREAEPQDLKLKLHEILSLLDADLEEHEV